VDLLVQGADYVIWHRLMEEANDRAMCARLDAMHAAQQTGCKTHIQLSSGRETGAPLMLIAEAAVAAQAGEEQGVWREQWIRALVNLAVENQQDNTTEGVVGVLSAMDSVISDMKLARVWPWLPQRRRAAKADQGQEAGAPAPAAAQEE
jgi:hypothetical protein